MIPHETIKVGLIGLGNMGQNHLRVLSILKKVDLHFIYDVDFDKAVQLANVHDTQAIERLDYNFLSSVDAVVICAPTSTHAAYIRQVYSYVKNIFVEKPMATTLAEATEIAKLVETNKLNLQVGFIERFNPAVQKLKAVLEGARSVINIDFIRTNKLSARIKDIDVVFDLMIHDVDLALYLNGPVASISSYGVVHEGNYIDFASAILKHKNSKFSHVVASRVTEKKMRKIEATCDGMFVDCELVRKEIVVNRQSEIHTNGGDSYRVSAIQENIEVKPQEALLLELQSFIASCFGEKSEANPTAFDGLSAIKVCEEIRNGILKS